MLAGRGFGKTRTGAEFIYENIDHVRRWVIAGRTSAETRDYLIEGESGVMNVGPPHLRPVYQPSRRRLEFPNGAVALIRAGEEPDSFRGLNVEGFWFDEFAAWKKPQESWDSFIFGLRSGDHPRGIVTTTPKPIPQIKAWVKEGAGDGIKTIAVTRGSTRENVANLATTFLRNVVNKYTGTRLGRQELDAEVLEDVPGALWASTLIEKLRVRPEDVPPLLRIVVGVDPEASSEEQAAETGIVAVGLGANGHGYVLHDWTIQGTPAVWGTQAVKLYLYVKGDRIVGEVNNGGEMVEHVIRTVEIDGIKVGAAISYKAEHASRGKQTRAEPISSLYEQEKVHHVGVFPEMETQMTGWVPGMDSPDRMDALVWALTELMGDSKFGGWMEAIRADSERRGAKLVAVGEQEVTEHGDDSALI